MTIYKKYNTLNPLDFKVTKKYTGIWANNANKTWHGIVREKLQGIGIIWYFKIQFTVCVLNSELSMNDTQI